MGLLAGYIEQLGTGTNDLIKRCVDKGLRRPEFRQDDSFVTILWRPTSHKCSYILCPIEGTFFIPTIRRYVPRTIHADIFTLQWQDVRPRLQSFAQP